jgi:hypothetical protein
MAEAHWSLRVICIVSCAIQTSFDCFSAFQVGHLLDDVRSANSPTGLFSINDLNLYYVRDLVSVASTFFTILIVCLLSVIVGWVGPVISYQKIQGNEIDRIAVMRGALANKFRSE